VNSGLPGGAGPSASVPRLVPFGERGILISTAEHADVESAARAHALADAIADATAGRPGWQPPIPTATSVLVPIDPIEPGLDEAIRLLSPLVDDLGSLIPDRRWLDAPEPIQIPVRYGGHDGPDLDVVAELAGLTRAAVIDLHASLTLRVLFLGFAPGFAYLGPLPPALAVPRRASPRTRVPAGSVAIAGPHAAVYPVASPGGWQVVGRTSMVLWDPERNPPAMLRPGDLVRFVPERAG
jgi:KipI family sensor histidine kinase inhibitor